MFDLLMDAAATADTGLHIGDRGALVAFADDIRSLRRFAAELIARRGAFRAVRLTPPRRRAASLQLSLFS
jgi:hypothetical protein